MKVHVRLKDSDYLQFCEYQLTHSRQGKRTILLQRLSLPLVSVAMVAAFVIFHASTRAVIIEIITLTLASLIWVIGAPGMLKSNVRRDFYKRKNNGSLPYRRLSVLEFGEDRVTEISGDESEEILYSSISSLARTDDRLFIFTDGRKGLVVPLDDAARNGRRVARLLSEKTGLEIAE